MAIRQDVLEKTAEFIGCDDKDALAAELSSRAEDILSVASLKTMLCISRAELHSNTSKSFSYQRMVHLRHCLFCKVAIYLEMASRLNEEARRRAEGPPQLRVYRVICREEVGLNDDVTTVINEVEYIVFAKDPDHAISLLKGIWFLKEVVGIEEIGKVKSDPKVARGSAREISSGYYTASPYHNRPRDLGVPEKTRKDEKRTSLNESMGASCSREELADAVDAARQGNDGDMSASYP